jgi:hypothetical protein
MSMYALLRATRDHLRDQLALREGACEVMFSGKPPAIAGEEFWAVHQRSWRGQHGDGDLDELYGVDVTCTRRFSGFAPWDRQGLAILLETNGGLYRRVERARVSLHKSYVLMATANALIEGFGVTVNGFEEPYLLASVGNPEPKGANWFHGKGGKGDAGIAMTISLAPARRLQKLEEAS